MSAANDTSDASSESTVSGASDENATTAAAEETPPAAEPFLRVLRGNPTDEEVAALVAVVGSAGGGVAEAGAGDRNMWGNPVDKLRIPVFSWQLITLRERTHMRR